ncbi:MAG: 6-carboxytetrahydropterin synthase [Bacteroidales bacterium]|jgi:6-pyruvoyltetrahydropterin/6-carboxytetrahydropterin synthase|nr:6-carboxytetrahydropterin synthase [Bacteroidales bacterium]MCR4800494.1 6-carboxytetrahydropterin synthase [Bacteroidales bacterium]
MTKIRITKEFVFDMAHALSNYDGKCKNIHGHTYKLFVTLIGIPCEDCSSPKNGMVLDFGDLKNIVKIPIVDVFDHALVVPANKGFEDLRKFQETDKYIEVPFQPTCENLTIYIANIIRSKLPDSVSLYSIRLYETPTSYAEWFADDNQ